MKKSFLLSNTFVRAVGMLLVLSTCLCASAQTREEKVREDRRRIESEGFWIYNDLDAAFRQAEQTGKPLMVVLRCVPCEECVKLDDELIDQNPQLRPLLEKFVRARQVSTNGLDLDLFQFDTDQSFAVFLLGADGTIYGRFGTRSHRTEWLGDVSVEGLAEALRGALQLHERSSQYRQSLAAKRGEPMEVGKPEQYPTLKDKYSDRLNYEGELVKSCIHCHQIGDAQREWYRNQQQPIPEKILFPYPHPKTIGLILDPDTRATVRQVVEDSPAARAGLRAGDEILRVKEQPILSIADIQWVLHQTDPAGEQLALHIRRPQDGSSAADSAGTDIAATITLPPAWRSSGDLSWRASSWGLRRMLTGGMLLEPLSDEQRAQHGLQSGQMALRAKHVGQYGPHAAAKQAGFQKEDILVAFDGRSDLMSESELFHYANSQCPAGERVDVVVLRDGERQTLQLPMQK